MTDDLNLEHLLNQRKRVAGYTAEQKAERKRRTNTASGLAVTALRRLHTDDYKELFRQAAAKIEAELGPIIPDEDPS